MIKKITSSLLVIGLIISYLILGYSNSKVRIDDSKDVLFLVQIGDTLFNLCHILIFAVIYFNNRLLDHVQLLIFPILVQFLDILPIDLLHSLKFSLFSMFSIGFGWLYLTYECIRVKNTKYVWIYLCSFFLLIISLIPGSSILFSNVDSKDFIYQIGTKIYSLDSFKVSFWNLGTINQSFSLSIYILLVFYSVSDFRKGIDS
jgi:hypothetical protein